MSLELCLDIRVPRGSGALGEAGLQVRAEGEGVEGHRLPDGNPAKDPQLSLRPALLGALFAPLHGLA